MRAGFDVLRKAGKLGAVLIQFSFSFHKSTETVAHLSALLRRFADYPLVVELRHSSWQVQATLDLLREHNTGFCNIDQPIIGNSLTPTAQSTSPTGYLRFHGRHYDTWFSDDPKLPAHERYNYLYSPVPWAARIQEVQKHTRNTFVVTNNHDQGKAVVNALQLLGILKGNKTERARRSTPALPATRTNHRRNASSADTFSARLTCWQTIEGIYFLKRFSNACRASIGRPVDGGSTGTCAGCM